MWVSSEGVEMFFFCVSPTTPVYQSSPLVQSSDCRLPLCNVMCSEFVPGPGTHWEHGQYWAVLIQHGKPCGRNKSWLRSQLEITMLQTSKPSHAVSCNWMMCSTLSWNESYTSGSKMALCFKITSPTEIAETSAGECLVNNVDICYVICRCHCFSASSSYKKPRCLCY